MRTDTIGGFESKVEGIYNKTIRGFKPIIDNVLEQEQDKLSSKSHDKELDKDAR